MQEEETNTQRVARYVNFNSIVPHDFEKLNYMA